MYVCVFICQTEYAVKNVMNQKRISHQRIIQSITGPKSHLTHIVFGFAQLSGQPTATAELRLEVSNSS